MSRLGFEKYKVDHLLLLVGENTLPNYVVAKLLLNKPGIAYLIHTADTKNEAQRLKNILQTEEFSVRLSSLNDYESDAYYIKEQIKDIFKSIESGKIGLNYTGGTKAMSAHSYRALFYEEVSENSYRKREGVVFNYLDARRLELCIDREYNERERLKVKANILKLRLETLFKLQGLKLKSSPSQEVQLSNLVKEIIKIFAHKNLEKQWFNWYNKIFGEELHKKRKDGKRGDWKSETDLSNSLISLDDLQEELPEIVARFETEELLTKEKQLCWEKIKGNGNFKKNKHFCEWLDGKWLEHYVLQQIKEIASNQSIQDYGLNFDIDLMGTKNGFEFDVAFTVGYQLFAISCTTTSNRSLCKSKLFEAYLRAQQMGGDEARVGLVCCSDEPDSLKAEMASTLSNRKIAVFGRADLIDLSERIKQWIQENDRGTR